MKTIALPFLSVLLLALPLAAQSTTVSPPGFATKEGGNAAWRFGAYTNMRIQWIDGEVSAMRSVKGIGMRRDVSRQHPHVARTFKNVTIDLSHGNHATASSYFRSNYLTTPTRLFSKSLQLPSLPMAAVGPAAWDKRLHVSLRNPFTIPTNRDLLVEWTMTGGVFANNKPVYRDYYTLDAPAIGWAPAIQRHYGNGSIYGGAGCRDSNSGAGPGAYVYLGIFAETKTKRVRVQTGGWYFPPYTSVQTVVGIGLSASGIPIPGVACNRLHVDMTKPHVILRSQSTYAGSIYYYIPGAGQTLPFQSAWVGVPFVVQTGWADTKTRGLKLSGASTSIYPALAPASWKRFSMYAIRLPTYSGIVKSDSDVFPIVKYDN